MKGKVKCKYPGRYGKNHRTNVSKLCAYLNNQLRLEIKAAVEDNLHSIYPTQYGIVSSGNGNMDRNINNNI